MRCAVMDVVSWFLGISHQLWIDVSVRERESWKKRSVMVLLCDAGLRDVKKSGRGRHQVAARLGDYSGSEWAM